MSDISPNKPSPKTVFVVGAGASQEASLPVGLELKKMIARALDFRFEMGYRMVSGDDRIVEAIKAAVKSAIPPSNDINPFLKSARHIHDAMPQALSIDNFIDSHGGDKQIELCGKLAIVRTILEAESKSYMFIDSLQRDRKIKFDRLDNTWFHGFVQLLTESCKSSNLAMRLNSVALIIFNYDRCIEHYLYHAIQNYYSMSAEDVAELLHGLEIFHPYGAVGSLPWMNPKNAIEFGATPHPTQLLGLANQIKTFTEGTDESSNIRSIRAIMKSTHKIVFLGFAFHHLNIELLLPKATGSTSPDSAKRVFGTARGISQSDTDSISDDLAYRGGFSANKIKLRNDLTCRELFREYWRSMLFA
jgi:hypothetical protein